MQSRLVRAIHREMKSRGLEDVGGFATASGIALGRAVQVLDGAAISMEERDRLREFIGKGTWRLLAKDLGSSSSAEAVSQPRKGPKSQLQPPKSPAAPRSPAASGQSVPTMTVGQQRRRVSGQELPKPKPSIIERAEQIPADMVQLVAGLREDLVVLRDIHAKMGDRLNQLDQVVRIYSRFGKLK